MAIAVVLAAGIGVVARIAEAAGGDTTLVSRAGAGGGGGGAGNADSVSPSISGDGCRVAFASDASNLGGPDFAGRDVFVRDLCSEPNSTILVSAASGGGAANGPSSDPAISADGAHVAFVSQATNLESIDSDSAPDVFVRDLTTGATELVSVTAPLPVVGTTSAGGAAPSVSQDGRYVGFESVTSATQFGIVLGQGVFDLGTSDVFVRDTIGHTAQLASRSTFPLPSTGNSDSFAPSISGDGSTVAFESNASDLVAGDSNGVRDVFVADLAAQSATLASRASTPTGSLGNGPSSDAALSADGEVVAFTSQATNLAPGSSGQALVYTRDLSAAQTSLASVGQNGLAPASGAGSASISADGVAVAFVSSDQSLAGAPPTGRADVFVRNSAVPVTLLASKADGGGASGDADSSSPSISSNAPFVAFASPATNLSASDIDPVSDVFRHDLNPPPPGQSAAAVPVEGETVNLTPQSGRVTFQEPGDQSKALNDSELVAVGTVVNARNGRAELSSAYNESFQSTDVYGGRAEIKQRAGARPYVRFVLKGSLAGCGSHRSARASGDVATASGRRGRHLWGSGRGRYRTGGRKGAATVRGTTWLVGDRCDGSSRFYVKSSVSGEGVVVDDYGKPGRRNAVLGPGQSYVAR